MPVLNKTRTDDFVKAFFNINNITDRRQISLLIFSELTNFTPPEILRKWFCDDFSGNRS